jgi:hypothetical protein
MKLAIILIVGFFVIMAVVFAAAIVMAQREVKRKNRKV